MRTYKINCLIVLIFSGITACNKPEVNNLTIVSASPTEVVYQFSQNISQPIYADLAIKSIQLNHQIQKLASNPSAEKLDSCKLLWKETRAIWEKSEAFLFGPVASDNIDPRIDTWPINFNSLDSIIAGNEIISNEYLSNLEDALKGFHPIEYFLFGLNGNKKYTEIMPREMDYLVAASNNLTMLTSELSESWAFTNPSSYHFNFVNAGTANSTYLTKKAALLEVVNALSAICDEVANGKLFEPLNAQNSTLEESPFAQNSIIDFTNNIKGVQLVYLGNYEINGIGLSEFVSLSNLSLDSRIKLKLTNAISSLTAISVPFGTAIFSQPVQVQNAITAINELKNLVDSELINFVELNVKE